MVTLLIPIHVFSGTRTITITNPVIEETIPQIQEIVKEVQREGNLPQRNNNPLSITCGRTQKKWIDAGLAICKPVGDGRKFMRYNTPEIGFQAAEELITSVYGESTVDEMLVRWTDNGYSFNDKRVINSLTKDELSVLINKMSIKEGFHAKI